jgi:hypothetical protein
VFVHHVEMHEFWLWCGFKSFKIVVKKFQILTFNYFIDAFVAITPQKHSNHDNDPNHACLQPTSINIARPHMNDSIETKLIKG